MTERTPHPTTGGSSRTTELFGLPPEAEAWEQSQPEVDHPAGHLRFDVDPADAYEQRQPVPLDDDDYR